MIYHFPTGPRLLQGQGNDDNGIEELKETSDGKEDLSWTEYGGPEGPCPLPISIFTITNFKFSHY